MGKRGTPITLTNTVRRVSKPKDFGGVKSAAGFVKFFTTKKYKTWPRQIDCPISSKLMQGNQRRACDLRKIIHTLQQRPVWYSALGVGAQQQ